MPLMKLEPVSLSSAKVTETMVQEQIADDPSILGLGPDQEHGCHPRAAGIHLSRQTVIRSQAKWRDED
jgi:hypothetical protein